MAVTKKTFIGTIDLTPTWQSIMPTLVALANADSMQARDAAYTELTRMAKLADLYAQSTRSPDTLAKLKQCVGALEALVAERPSLPGKIAGDTTVGNTLAEARSAITQAEAQ